MKVETPPFIPVGGRVLIQQLPPRPSKILEVIDCDLAQENEGIVVALSECQYGRRKHGTRGWEHTGDTFPHSVKIGDRVLFPGTYQDEDIMRFNGIKYRALNSWEIIGILDAPPTEGYEDPISGEVRPDKHPLLIH